jgi:hypothetical protein
MIIGSAKLACLAAICLAAVMLVLGGASRAEAHGRHSPPVAPAAHGPAVQAPTATTGAVLALEAEGRGPVRVQKVLHGSGHQPPPADQLNDTLCCSGAACHGGVAALSPAPSLRELTGAKLPLPRCYGSPSRLPSGIERPPRRPSTI